MYRYEVLYDTGDTGDYDGSKNSWQLLDSQCYKSLDYAKRKARKACNDFGGCNGVATMFYIYSVKNEYDAGYQIYKSRIF